MIGRKALCKSFDLPHELLHCASTHAQLSRDLPNGAHPAVSVLRRAFIAWAAKRVYAGQTLVLQSFALVPLKIRNKPTKGAPLRYFIVPIAEIRYEIFAYFASLILACIAIKAFPTLDFGKWRKTDREKHSQAFSLLLLPRQAISGFTHFATQTVLG
jgi:hypothetical protein